MEGARLRFVSISCYAAGFHPKGHFNVKYNTYDGL